MGGNEKSAKGYMAKENIAKGYIDKATTRPEGRSLRAPKWDEAKNRPKGTSTRSFSTRGYINKGSVVPIERVRCAEGADPVFPSFQERE